MKHHVLLSLASCVSQERNMERAVHALAQLLDNLRVSRTLWTDDIHGRGRRYLNQLAAGDTPLTADELNSRLKNIERRMGRTPGEVTIDLDLMSYDGERHHLNDWPRPYIQLLINDIFH